MFWCCSSCSRLWLIIAPWKFSLCTDLLQKLLFISWPYHSFSHLLLLTFLHLTELNCLVCSLFTSQIPYTPHMLLSLSFPVCSSLMGGTLFSHYWETFPSGLVREEQYVSCRTVLSFKCPGGMYVGKMKIEFGKCLLKLECCGVAKNKVLICASRSCQKNHAESFERWYYLSDVKAD